MSFSYFVNILILPNAVICLMCLISCVTPVSITDVKSPRTVQKTDLIEIQARAAYSYLRTDADDKLPKCQEPWILSGCCSSP